MAKKKLTPEQQFFNDKTLDFAKELYNQNEEKLKESYRGQINSRDMLLNKIAKILLSYNIADNILKISAADKKRIYTELSDLIVTNIKSELDFETSLTEKILTRVGKEKYNVNNYVYGLGANFNLTQLSDEALEKIINTKVKDKLWSDRLYDNKNDMCNVLQTEVEKFLKGETNVNQIEQKIIDKYDTNAHETKRLVQDNICRVQEGANDEWQHEHNIKYVMYMATLDGKVCANCAQYDGKPFELDKKPVQIPRHPFCRCVYISLVNKDWHPKMRLDNETKENINWQSYEEWKKNYIDNNPERLLNHKMVQNKSSDKKIYDKYKEILGKEIPKTLEDFQKVKYNNIDKWNELKNNFKIVNSYKLDFGSVSPQKILELDKLAFIAKRDNQISKYKKQGNFAILQYGDKTKFASSRIASISDVEFIKYKGDKEDLVLLKEKRIFSTSKVGDIVDGVVNNIPRYLDTEAKFFEYISDKIAKENIKEIFMLSEKAMCESCKGVAKQFIDMYPNIKVNIVSGKTFDGWKGR